MSQLFVVGLNHRTAPVEIREALVLPSEDQKTGRFLQDMTGLCAEAMLLSTCNRSEVYGVLPRDCTSRQAIDDCLRRVSAHLVQAQPQAREHLYQWVGEGALRHLFRVASSLDSMIVGEPQILGQVKQAFRMAETVGTCGPVLSTLVPRSFAVAKRVRNETSIGRSAASVASVAVELAQQVFGNLADQPVLLIGAGKMAELCARHLREAGVREFAVLNRTLERAQDLASRVGAVAHPYSSLEEQLGQAAIVLCSSGSPQPILQADLIARVMRARRGRWLVLIDIAVPRDVSPQVGQLSNVYLYDIDSLSAVVSGNLSDRSRAAESAGTIVQEELQRVLERDRRNDVVPVIRALRERAQDIAQAEVAKVLPRLGELGDRERQLVGALADAVINKLLHSPLTVLKQGQDDQQRAALAEAVCRLWDLPQSRGLNRAAPKSELWPEPREACHE